MSYVKKTHSQMIADSFIRAEVENFEIEVIYDTEVIIRNIDKNTIYKLFIEGDYIINCDCPHHIFRGIICKHIIFVSNAIGKYICGF